MDVHKSIARAHIHFNGSLFRVWLLLFCLLSILVSRHGVIVRCNMGTDRHWVMRNMGNDLPRVVPSGGENSNKSLQRTLASFQERVCLCPTSSQTLARMGMICRQIDSNR